MVADVNLEGIAPRFIVDRECELGLLIGTIDSRTSGREGGEAGQQRREPTGDSCLPIPAGPCKYFLRKPFTVSRRNVMRQ